MKPKVYIESSVISYLTARVSSSLTVAAHQQITQQWWDTHRQRYELYISLSVRDEIQAGDKDAAKARLQTVAGIPMVAYTEDITSVVKALLAGGAVPPKAAEDALHFALSATNGIESPYLELPSHRERQHQAGDRAGAAENGVRLPHHLHAARITWGK